MTPPTVFIVDDDLLTRSSYEAVLHHTGIHCELFRSAQEFLQQYEPRRPGCLLLDIQMPEMTGLELQGELNRRGALIPIIFITGFAEIPLAVDAMSQGAFDYLQKPVDKNHLLDRVRRALAKDAALRARLRERDQTAALFWNLTERERKVLTLVMDGLSNKQAAGHLRLSARTVELHRASILKKTGARNTAHLVRLATELQVRTKAVG